MKLNLNLTRFVLAAALYALGHQISVHEDNVLITSIIIFAAGTIISILSYEDKGEKA